MSLINNIHEGPLNLDNEDLEIIGSQTGNIKLTNGSILIIRGIVNGEICIDSSSSVELFGIVNGTINGLGKFTLFGTINGSISNTVKSTINKNSIINGITQ